MLFSSTIKAPNSTEFGGGWYYGSGIATIIGIAQNWDQFREDIRPWQKSFNRNWDNMIDGARQWTVGRDIARAAQDTWNFLTGKRETYYKTISLPTFSDFKVSSDWMGEGFNSVLTFSTQFVSGSHLGHQNFINNIYTGVSQGVPMLMMTNHIANLEILNGNFSSGFGIYGNNVMNIAKGVVSPITQTYSGVNHLIDGNAYLAGADFAEAGDGIALSLVTYGAGRGVGAFSGLSKSIGSIKIPVYRVYGGGASMYGRSYSLINPRYVPNYRNFAGLPKVNSGQYLLKGHIPLRDIRVGRWFASPLNGNTGGLPFEFYLNYNQLVNKRLLIINKPF